MSEKKHDKKLHESVKCHCCSKHGCTNCKDESERELVKKDWLVGNNGGN